MYKKSLVVLVIYLLSIIGICTGMHIDNMDLLYGSNFVFLGTTATVYFYLLNKPEPLEKS